MLGFVMETFSLVLEGLHSIHEDTTQNICPLVSVNVPETQIKPYFLVAVDVSRSSCCHLLKHQQAISRFDGRVFKLAGELYFNGRSCLPVAELCNISGLQHRSYYLLTPPHPWCTVEIKSCLKLLIIPLHEAQRLTLSVKSRALNQKRICY